MKRIIITTVLTGLLIVAGAAAQTKTVEETRTESQTQVDSTTGKVVTTSSVVSLSKREDITPRSHMISVDPIKFWMMYNINYHYALTPLIAVGGGIQAPTTFAPDELSGFGFTLDAQFYVAKRSFRGFYVSPTFSLTSISYDDYVYDAGGSRVDRRSETPISLGLYTGWTFSVFEDCTTQLALGADLNIVPTTAQNVIGLGSSEKGLTPGAKLTIGYAW
jgi:hypothetical protein